MGVAARCNGAVECADASDERGCGAHTCGALGPDALSCRNGSGCYLRLWTCDGYADCADGTDERDCGHYHSGQYGRGSAGLQHVGALRSCAESYKAKGC